METELSVDFFAEWIDTLGDFLGKRLEPKVSDIYYNRLKRLSDEEFLRAIEKAINCAEQFKFPSPDKLIEYALGTPEQRAYAKIAACPADMPRLPGAPKSNYAPIALFGKSVVLHPQGCPAGDNLRAWHIGRLKCSVDAAKFCHQTKLLLTIFDDVQNPNGDIAKLGITWEEVKDGFCH